MNRRFTAKALLNNIFLLIVDSEAEKEWTEMKKPTSDAFFHGIWVASPVKCLRKNKTTEIELFVNASNDSELRLYINYFDSFEWKSSLTESERAKDIDIVVGAD